MRYKTKAEAERVEKEILSTLTSMERQTVRNTQQYFTIDSERAGKETQASATRRLSSLLAFGS